MKKKLFISYSHKDKDLVESIRHKLFEKSNYIILSDHNVLIGEDFSNAILSQIKESDYYLIFLSPNYVISTSAINEFNKIIGYSQNANKQIIPVLLKETSLPSDISKLQYLNVIGLDADNAAELINTTINQIEGRLIAEKQKFESRAKQIQSSISDYIEPTLDDLKKRENSLKYFSIFWNVLGYLALVAGIGSIITLIILDSQSNTAIDWPKVIYTGVKGSILLILLLSVSKYAFTLAKSYMNESLKVAGRIHAISFGKYYLKVFEQTITSQDFKDIFQHWNLNSDSSFSTLSTDSYDPKLYDFFSKTLDAVKDIKK